MGWGSWNNDDSAVSAAGSNNSVSGWTAAGVTLAASALAGAGVTVGKKSAEAVWDAAADAIKKEDKE